MPELPSVFIRGQGGRFRWWLGVLDGLNVVSQTNKVVIHLAGLWLWIRTAFIKKLVKPFVWISWPVRDFICFHHFLHVLFKVCDFVFVAMILGQLDLTLNHVPQKFVSDGILSVTNKGCLALLYEHFIFFSSLGTIGWLYLTWCKWQIGVFVNYILSSRYLLRTKLKVLSLEFFSGFGGGVLDSRMWRIHFFLSTVESARAEL